MQLSCAIVDFYLFHGGPVDIKIRVLWTRNKCQVSDTQVTVKSRGPFLVFFSRTKRPISTKLDTKHPWVKGIQICTIDLFVCLRFFVSLENFSLMRRHHYQ